LTLFPSKKQIDSHMNHPRYPLNDKEKKRPHLMKKRSAVFRNPQSISNKQFNSMPQDHQGQYDPNGNLTLRDSLLVNMIADDVQSELFFEETNDLKPKIGMPYDRITPQHAEISQSRTVDTVTLNLDQLEQYEKTYVNATDHGKTLCVNVSAQWNPTSAKYDDDGNNEGNKRYQIWEHAFLQGNWVRPHQTQSNIPSIHFPSDTTQFDSNKLYSVVLVTSDYPHRLHSDPGVFVHWWVANIPGTNNCQQMNEFIQKECSSSSSSNSTHVMYDYLAPLPCEYGGVGRYYIMIYEQDATIDNKSLDQFKELSVDAKYKQSQRYLDHLKNMSKNVHWYEQDHVFTQIDQKMIHNLSQFDPSTVEASEIGDSEYRLNHNGSTVDPKLIQAYNDRRSMSLAKMFNNRLPHGLCYSKIEYEFSVTEYLQEKGMGALEREYVPPDLVWKRILKKNQFVKRQDRYINNEQWL